MKKSLDDTKMKENCPSWVKLIMIYIKKINLGLDDILSEKSFQFILSFLFFIFLINSI
jgi:hypothetical protein